MKNPTASPLALAFSTVLALAAFACSGSAPDGGLGSSSKDGKTPTTVERTDDKASTTTDTDKTTPAPSTPASDSSECGKKSTSQACGECCLAKTPTALDAADAAFFDCLCGATACQTACADSVCAAADNQNEPTAACKTCLDTNEPMCETKATAVCDASAACKAASACLTTACDPIAAKENPSGGGNTPKVLRARVGTRASRLQ